jgi:hypothetical protein
MNTSHSEPTLNRLLGRVVIVDMAAPFVILGTLAAHDEQYLIIGNADVHDLRDTNTTRDIYVADSLRLGIRANRKQVFVRLQEVICVSALDDVIV